MAAAPARDPTAAAVVAVTIPALAGASALVALELAGVECAGRGGGGDGGSPSVNTLFANGTGGGGACGSAGDAFPCPRRFQRTQQRAARTAATAPMLATAIPIFAPVESPVFRVLFVSPTPDTHISSKTSVASSGSSSTVSAAKSLFGHKEMERRRAQSLSGQIGDSFGWYVTARATRAWSLQ